MDTAIAKELAATLNNRLFKFETGNTINKKTTYAIIAIIYRHLITFAAQHISRSQTSWSCPDYTCRKSIFRSHVDGLNPTFFKGSLSYMFFNCPNSDRFETLFNYTIAFA